MADITIVIPFHNRAQLLPRTLLSLSRQSYADYSLLLVDNNSSDDSAAVAADMIKQRFDNLDARLISCSTPGAAAARNAGLAATVTPYVYFFDSDDEISPGFLSETMPLLRQSQADILMCYTNMSAPDGTLRPRRYGLSNNPVHQILSGVLSTQSVVWRTEYLRHIGGWDERLPYWNDWELGTRLLLHRPKTVSLPRAYHTIHLQPDSITGSDYTSRLPLMLRALEAVRQDILQLSGHDLPQLLRALHYRAAIMAGAIASENHKAPAPNAPSASSADSPTPPAPPIAALRLLAHIRRQRPAARVWRRCLCLYALKRRRLPRLWRLAEWWA